MKKQKPLGFSILLLLLAIPLFTVLYPRFTATSVDNALDEAAYLPNISRGCPQSTPTATYSIGPTPTPPFEGILQVYPIYSGMDGWGWPAHAKLEVEITSSEGVQKEVVNAIVDGDGMITWTNIDHELIQGDMVTIKLGSRETQFSILMVDAIADPQTNRITGTAVPHLKQRAMIEHPRGQFTILEGVSDSNGKFAFDFSSKVDWEYGDNLWVGQHVSANGLVQVTQSSPELWVHPPLAETALFIEESIRLRSMESIMSAYSATGDIDKDGSTDIVISYLDLQELPANGRQGPLRVFDNDGNGYFEESSFDRLCGEKIYASTRGIALEDLTQDGWPDIILATEDLHSPPYTEYRDRILVNHSGKYFLDETSARFPDYATFSHGLCLGDVDNDHDLDIFFNFHSLPTGLMINDGHGYFSIASQSLPKSIEYDHISCEFGDYDNDGTLDLFLGTERFDDRNVLLYNDGTGIFNLAPRNALPEKPGGNFDLPLQAAAADFNADGYLDIVTANANYWGPDGQPIDNHEPRLNQLMINNGNGTFRDATSDLPQSFGGGVSWDIAAVDIDNDGDVDIIPANTYTDNGVVFINDGNGHFTEFVDTILPSPGKGVHQNQVLVFDMDLDGDKDIIFTIENHNPLVYRNKINSP